MAVNLDTFYSNINNAFMTKATHMLRHWRIGSTANFCKTENELLVTVMYLDLLRKLGIIGYILTDDKIEAIIKHLVEIYKIKGVTDIDIASLMSQGYNIITIYTNGNTDSIQPYEINYAGIDEFTKYIEWNSNGFLPNVEIYELEDDNSYTRVYPEISIGGLLSTSTHPKYGISISFASSSHGKIIIR